MGVQAHLVELERKHKILENELHEALVHQFAVGDLVALERERGLGRQQVSHRETAVWAP